MKFIIVKTTSAWLTEYNVAVDQFMDLIELQ